MNGDIVKEEIAGVAETVTGAVIDNLVPESKVARLPSPPEEALWELPYVTVRDVGGQEVIVGSSDGEAIALLEDGSEEERLEMFSHELARAFSHLWGIREDHVSVDWSDLVLYEDRPRSEAPTEASGSDPVGLPCVVFSGKMDQHEVRVVWTTKIVNNVEDDALVVEVMIKDSMGEPTWTTGHRLESKEVFEWVITQMYRKLLNAVEGS